MRRCCDTLLLIPLEFLYAELEYTPPRNVGCIEMLSVINIHIMLHKRCVYILLKQVVTRSTSYVSFILREIWQYLGQKPL